MSKFDEGPEKDGVKIEGIQIKTRQKPEESGRERRREPKKLANWDEFEAEEKRIKRYVEMTLRKHTAFWLFLFSFLAMGLHAQNDGTMELLDAIEQDDYKTVKKLVKQGVPLNQAILQKKQEYTFFISRENYLRAIGAKEDREYIYITPLQLAALLNREKIAKYLMKKRANLDGRDSQGKTALMYALWHPGGEELALYLIKRGANFAAKDDMGNSALHYAAFGGNSEGIHMTFGGGNSPKAGNDQGITPFMAAAIMAEIPTLEQLADIGSEVLRTDSMGMNALHYAAAYGDEAKLHWLVNKGLKVNDIADNNYAPLDIAEIAGNRAAVNFLKENGAVYHAYKFDELCKAAEEGNTAKVRALLDEGINPNCRSDFSPLHIAARNGDVGITNWLLKAGADPNVVSEKAGRPIEEALRTDNPGPAITLMEAGSIFPPQLVSVLLEKWAQAGVKSTWEELISRVVKSGVELDVPGGTESLTALQYAAWQGDPAMVKQLVEAGANPKVADARGWTALHWNSLGNTNMVSGEKKKEIAIALKDAGAELNARTGKLFKIPAANGRPAAYFPPNISPLDILDCSRIEVPELEAYLIANGVVRHMTAADYNSIGMEQLKNGDYRTAMEDFSDAIRLSPNSAHAYMGRGTAMVGLNLYREAERDLEIALDRMPENGEAYYQMGIVKFELKDFIPAERMLAKAIELDPENLDAYWYRGQNFLKLKQRNNACNQFVIAGNKGHEKSRKSHEIHCNE